MKNLKIGYFFQTQNIIHVYTIYLRTLSKKREKKIKNLLRFIINKGFDIDEKNNNIFSFRELCTIYGINNYLDDVLKEFKKPKT